ncbi:MAG: hypothetical protein FWC60_02475 [Firmicutes bacterium]|nr:hypothetical protein [Bacillota bacterium]
MKIFGLVLIVIGVVAAMILQWAEITIIIQLGIRTFSMLRMIAVLIAGIGVIVTVIGFGRNIRVYFAQITAAKQIAASREAESRPTLSYSAAAYDPADIRQRLEQLSQKRSDLTGLLKKCIEQMDAMDRRQARLKELLDLNAAEYLRNTEELLGEVEQYLCKNFRKIINRGIVSELDDDRLFASDGKYATDAELIEAVLADNQRELDNIKKFLADLAELISENHDNAETTLEAWMSIIRDSLKKEEA